MFIYIDKPVVMMVNNPSFYMVNEVHKIRCSVMAFPEPKIEWYFKDCSQYPTCNASYISITVSIVGNNAFP